MEVNIPQLVKILSVIVQKPENRTCADCSMPNPTWASCNLGVFICMNCSGMHRMLGTHISRIRSISLDRWDEAGVQTMAQVGNRLANSYWECKLKPRDKITSNADEQARMRFVRSKYEQRLWYGQPYESTQESHPVTQRPDEVGLTREQKILHRQKLRTAQGRQGGSTAISTHSSQYHAPSSGHAATPKPVSNRIGSAAPFSSQFGHTPSLKHASSTPHISEHISDPADLFAGLTTKMPMQSSLRESVSAEPQHQVPVRPKRLIGHSPWVQRPADSDLPIQHQGPSTQTVSLFPSTETSASSAYANLLVNGHVAEPIDLLSFIDPLVEEAPFRSGLAPVTEVDLASSFGSNSDLLPIVPEVSFLNETNGSSVETSSGFSFVEPTSLSVESGTEPSIPAYGFEFVTAAVAAPQFEAKHPRRLSAVSEDVFGDLLPPSDAAPPELAPLEHSPQVPALSGSFNGREPTLLATGGGSDGPDPLQRWGQSSFGTQSDMFVSDLAGGLPALGIDYSRAGVFDHTLRPHAQSNHPDLTHYPANVPQLVNAGAQSAFGFM